MSITRHEIKRLIQVQVPKTEEIQRQLQSSLLDILSPVIREKIEIGENRVEQDFIGNFLDKEATRKTLEWLWLKQVSVEFYEREHSRFGQQDTKITFSLT
jgi:hypothetical protein